MRVISGRAKGRRLYSVPGPGTRPITDRAKSGLFSILGARMDGLAFLDLFAGTGQVGIEALSRGAGPVVFVEKGGLAIKTIYQNLKVTELGEDAEVVRDDVFHYLRGAPRPFEFVYVAPPQYRGLWAQTLRALDLEPGWLTEDGWAIAQINPLEYEPQGLENLALFDQREYGSVMLCFYHRKAEKPSTPS
jgi:16S rRNA (guanine(966)-N(2))-methyltransferase RsmD